MKTHESQHCPQKMESEVLNFLDAVHSKVIGINCHPKFMLTMDEMHVAHMFHGRPTFTLRDQHVAPNAAQIAACLHMLYLSFRCNCFIIANFMVRTNKVWQRTS